MQAGSRPGAGSPYLNGPKPPAAPKRQPETLSHAVARMRSQGYDTKHITGQIHRWHPDWNADRIGGALGVTPHHGLTAVNKQGRPLPAPPSDWGLGVAKGVLHGAEHLGKAELSAIPLLSGHPLRQGNPGPMLAIAKRQAQSVYEPLRHPLRNPESTALDVAGLLPLGKLGQLGRALKTAKPLEAEAVAAGRPTAAALANSRAEVSRLKQVHAALSAKHEAAIARVPPRRIPVKWDEFSRYAMPDVTSEEILNRLPNDGEHLYHATSADSLARVAREGLRPGKERPGEVTGVYFGQDGIDLQGLVPGRRRAADVWLRVKRGNVKTEVTDMYTPGHGAEEHVSRQAVSPSAIEFLGSDNQWHPLASFDSRAHAPTAVAANAKRAARLASIQDKIAAHEQMIARGGELSTHEKIQTNLPAAKAARTKQAAGYSEEKSRRVAAADQALHSTPGMAGFHAALAEHRGELPKIHFTGFGDLTPENLDHAAEIIKTHPHLQHYDKIRVAKALSAAVDEGKVPTPSDLKLIEHVFGKETNGALSKTGNVGRFATLGSEILNAPRALTTTLDASGLFRQALVLGPRHPWIFARNIKTYFAAMAKESNYVGTLERIHADPAYPMANTAGLAITDLEHGLGNQEENLAGLPLVEKFTGGKHSPIRMSGRGYTAGLDAMRFDVFKQILRNAQHDGVNIHDEKFLKDLGRDINTITGRGQSGIKSVEQAMPFLNNLLFSPRLLKSRFDIFFNPAYYARLHPYVRRHALSAAFSTLGMGVTVLGLAYLAGGKVGLDPTSADFGKIRLGNTRIDIWGGFQQPARLLAQIAYGHVTSTTTGKTLNLGPTGPGKLSRGDIALRFGVSKLAPAPSFAWDAMFGRNQIGQKFHAGPEALQRLWPLALQDATDLYKQHHGGMNGIEAALGGYVLSGIGFGVQTYGPKKPKSGKTPTYLSPSSSDGGSPYLSNSSSGGSGSAYLGH